MRHIVIDNTALKEKAKQQFTPHLKDAIIAAIIAGVAMSALSGTVIGGLIAYGPLTVGMIFLAFKWIKGENGDVATFIDGLKINLTNTIIAGAIISLAVGIGTCFLIVPGVFIWLMFFPALYLLVENPEMDWKTALQQSKDMMEGHKMELFMLTLSFIGWILLTIVTCGLAGFYVAPYMGQTFANYYLELKNGAAPAAPAADASATGANA